MFKIILPLMVVSALMLTVQANKEQQPVPKVCDLKFWKHSIYPEIKSVKKKVINLTAKIYDEKLINNSTGEFLSNRPWFVIFVTDPMYYCDTFKYMLQNAAKELDGKV